jgi:hypothetical protein
MCVQKCPATLNVRHNIRANGLVNKFEIPVFPQADFSPKTRPPVSRERQIDAYVLGPSASVYALLPRNNRPESLPRPNFVSREE